MADGIVSDNREYTIHLTREQYKKHQRLFYIGSLMSQYLCHAYFVDLDNKKLSYCDALTEITNHVKHGEHYSSLWDELAFELQEIYHKH